MRNSVVSALLVSLLIAGAAAAPGAPAVNPLSQWPQWRGPIGTGVAPDGDPPLTWSETENLRWKVTIPGRGHASPIVWGDQVFVLTAVEVDPDAAPDAAEDSATTDDRPRGTQAEGPVQFVVMALDRGSGKMVWQRIARTAVPHEGTHQTATWASASAATDGEVLVASFGSNGIYAYDLEGELLWERDLGDQATRNAFGEGSSPVIHGSKVIVNWDHEGDSFVVALDRDSGEPLWRRERDEPTSWSTPLVVEAGGRAQVITSASNRVRAYDLETGEVVWHVGGMTLNVIPTPSFADGLIYLMSGFRGNSLLAVRLDGAAGDLDGTEHVVWTHDRDTSYTPSGLVYEGTYYFVKRNNGILSALDARTGEVLFGPERLEAIDGDGGIYASLVGAAGRVYITGQNGTTLVLRRGPELDIVATNRLDDGFDASPAIAGSQLFLRGREHLYCFEAEDRPSQAPSDLDEPTSAHSRESATGEN